MSLAVSLEALQPAVEDAGPTAYLVTVSDDGAPHVVSVLVRLEDGELLVGATRTSARNVEARARTTLLWASAHGGEYSLIVDGDAVVRGEPEPAIAIRPVSAVLHRVAGAAGSGPRCMPVTQDA
jgi:hypothetical protein